MRKLLVLPTLVGTLLATAASAGTIEFGLPDFTASTVTTTGVNLLAPTTNVPSLPGDATFSQPFDAGLAAGEGRFLRFNFDLPADFRDLSFEFSVSVNDEFALYLNDTVIAAQADTLIDNFLLPLPGVSLTASGVASDSSGKLDYLLDGTSLQALFQAGENELTLFGTDTVGASGGFSAGRDSANDPVRPIDTTLGTVSFVPEPTTLLLFGAGLALLAVRPLRR